RAIRSEFIRLDMHSWLISAVISVALVISFSLACLMRGTALDWVIPYIDPAVLAVLSPILMRAPLQSARRAFREMTLVTPPDLDSRVRGVLSEFIARRGFPGFSSYAAKVGRAAFIEVYVMLPKDLPLAGIEDLDEMRAEID